MTTRTPVPMDRGHYGAVRDLVGGQDEGLVRVICSLAMSMNSVDEWTAVPHARIQKLYGRKSGRSAGDVLVDVCKVLDQRFERAVRNHVDQKMSVGARPRSVRTSVFDRLFKGPPSGVFVDGMTGRTITDVLKDERVQVEPRSLTQRELVDVLNDVPHTRRRPSQERVAAANAVMSREKDGNKRAWGFRSIASLATTETVHGPGRGRGYRLNGGALTNCPNTIVPELWPDAVDLDARCCWPAIFTRVCEDVLGEGAAFGVSGYFVDDPWEAMVDEVCNETGRSLWKKRDTLRAALKCCITPTICGAGQGTLTGSLRNDGFDEGVVEAVRRCGPVLQFRDLLFDVKEQLKKEESIVDSQGNEHEVASFGKQGTLVAVLLESYEVELMHAAAKDVSTYGGATLAYRYDGLIVDGLDDGGRDSVVRSFGLCAAGLRVPTVLRVKSV